LSHRPRSWTSSTAFIQEHPRALAELKKDASLIRTAEFATEHKAVGEYLAQHPTVKDELKKYPNFLPA
jgi:hypothetical protein